MNFIPTSTYKKLFTLVPLVTFALLLLQYLKLNKGILNQNLARKSNNSQRFEVNCEQVIQGDPWDLERADNAMTHFPKIPVSPQKYIKLSRNCTKFKSSRGYILNALSKTEQTFPIGFSITIYKDIEQFERLLRAIYRPQNYYCIHVDKKSPDVFHQAVLAISSCFPNVFRASKIINVYWGQFSVLQSDLICMKDLWKRSKLWKYFINLTGQEFPLKTNNELVKVLRKLKGRSIVKGEHPTNRRLKNRFFYIYSGGRRTGKRKEPFRLNFTFYKGTTHVVLSRAFVNFTLHEKVATDFLEWVQDTGIPDETFYPTLYLNVHFDNNVNISYAPPTRYKNWGSSNCHGKLVRRICINGIADLKRITKHSALFVNKFHLDYQYLALDCLEQWLHNRTLAYYTFHSSM